MSDEIPEQNIAEDHKNIVELTSRIDELLEENPKFKELIKLKNALLTYKKEIQDKIDKGIPYRNVQFKKVLFGNLEKALIKFVYIIEKNIRDDHIKKAYYWYQDRWDKYAALDQIRERTDKNPDEVYKPEEIVSDEILILDDKYLQKQMREHRTAPPPGLESATERLNEYIYREVNPNPPKAFQKSKQVLEDLRFNLDRFHGKVGTANHTVTLKQNAKRNYPLTGKKYTVNSAMDVDTQLKPINPKREVKSSYSTNRPKYEMLPLLVEKEVINAKHKELAEKRHQEEIEKMLEEFGKNKARFKEQQELKFNNRNVVSATQKHFKKNKTPEEIAEEEDDNILEQVPEINDEESVMDMFEHDENVKEKDNNAPLLKRNISPTAKTNIMNKVVYSRIINIPKPEEKQKKIDINEKEVKRVFKIIINPQTKDANKGLFENKKAIIENKIEALYEDKSLKEEQKKINRDKITAELTGDFFSNGTEDRVLKQRILSANICKVRQIHNPVDPEKYKGIFRPLSVFDNANVNEYRPETGFKTATQFRPQSASQFAKQNYETYYDDFLGLRKKLSEFKKDEAEYITEGVFTGINSEKKTEAFMGAVLCPDGAYGHKVTRPFSSLLRRPAGKKKKKKKKKKK